MKRIIASQIVLLAVSANAPVLAREMSSFTQFEECTAVTSWLMNGKDTHKIEKTRRVKIPDGWKVVGSSIFSDKTPIFYICR